VKLTKGRPDASLKMPLAPLSKLAQLYGIQTAYYDVFRRRREASAESLLETLRALGAPVDRFADVADALRECQQEMWRCD